MLKFILDYGLFLIVISLTIIAIVIDKYNLAHPQPKLRTKEETVIEEINK